MNCNCNEIGSLIAKPTCGYELLATLVKEDQKAPFSIATTPKHRGGR